MGNWKGDEELTYWRYWYPPSLCVVLGCGANEVVLPTNQSYLVGVAVGVLYPSLHVCGRLR